MEIRVKQHWECPKKALLVKIYATLSPENCSKNLFFFMSKSHQFKNMNSFSRKKLLKEFACFLMVRLINLKLVEQLWASKIQLSTENKKLE